MATSKETSEAKWSPEYETLKQCFPNLIVFLREPVDTIADHMLSKNILPLEVRQGVADKTVAKHEKIRDILLWALSQTRLNPSMYHTFIQVLKEQGEWVDPMVKQLEECYDANQGVKNKEVPAEIVKDEKVQEIFHVKAAEVQQVPWGDNDGTTTVAATGERHVLFIVPNFPTDNPNIVPRRTRGPLTEEERMKLEEQGVPKECHYSDLTIMMARYLLDRRTTVVGFLAGEKATCENVKKQVMKLMNKTPKAGIILHYIGPGKKETGDWCFSDGFISFREIMDIYTQNFKKRVLTISSDCSYSGAWVREAMTFMDEQGAGPCGHVAKEKEILIKMYTSCQPAEIPAELAFSTHCVSSDKYTGDMIYTGHLQTTFYEIYPNQHPSGLDYTSLRCGTKDIEEECVMTPGSTWKEWSAHGDRIYAIGTRDVTDKPTWAYFQFEGKKINKIVRVPSMITGGGRTTVDYSDTGM